MSSIQAKHLSRHPPANNPPSLVLNRLIDLFLFYSSFCFFSFFHFTRYLLFVLSFRRIAGCCCSSTKYDLSVSLLRKNGAANVISFTEDTWIRHPINSDNTLFNIIYIMRTTILSILRQALIYMYKLRLALPLLSIATAVVYPVNLLNPIQVLIHAA